MKNRTKNFLYQKHTFWTSLSQEEITLRLNTLIENDLAKRKRDWKGNINTKKEYEGAIFLNTFCMNRIISYRNSVLPDIYGTILSSQNLSQLILTMRPNLAVHIFSALITFVIVLLSFFLMPYLFYTDGFEIGMLVVYLFPLFTYLILILPFQLECKKTVQALIALLELKTEEN